MSYAVLSLPYVENLESKFYTPDSPSNMSVRAETHARASGFDRGDDFEIWQPMDTAEYIEALDDIRQRTVVYIDAHGDQTSNTSDGVGSKINVPASTNDREIREWVSPVQLGLRDSSVELVILGACFQLPESWEYAVPPGCKIIGYSQELWHTHYPHIYERFIDLPELLKDGRAPEPHEQDAWLEHITDWLDQYIHGNANPTESSDWFITVGKQ